MKRCGSCKLRKAYAEFYKNISTPDGYSWNCKHCTNNYAKNSRVGKYGITKDHFAYMLNIQENRCPICQVVFGPNNPPAIDHDHSCCPTKVGTDRLLSKKCGKCVRGLLCTRCNAGLGMLGDNVQRLISAINYLKSYNSEDFFADELSLELLTLVYEISG
jgi:hypothetical protein